MNRHFNNRAVSQVIAALLLIAIAVAAAILLYVFAIGLLGSLGSSGGQQTKEQLILESYHWDMAAPPGTIVLTLRNVGSASIDTEHTDVFINGIQITSAPGGSCAATLTPTQSCTSGTLTPSGTSYVAGAAYPLKLVTPDGGVFSYSVIAGGST
jgi:flagellin-like protein